LNVPLGIVRQSRGQTKIGRKSFVLNTRFSIPVCAAEREKRLTKKSRLVTHDPAKIILYQAEALVLAAEYIPTHR
jgi:hypothetical protein